MLSRDGSQGIDRNAHSISHIVILWC